jgi:hypothetical protein
VLRIIAIDWSGARTGAEKKIRAAHVADGALTLEPPVRNRDQVVEWLVALKDAGDDLIVGFDFAFSTPGWWLSKQGFADAPAFWRWLVSGNADALLSECALPFWGRRGTNKPGAGGSLLRRTDGGAIAGIRQSPKSVFQIAGAGAVGTGSLRGMACLCALREAGFAIWPFDAPGLPLAVEIYPRAFTGPVVKSSRGARIADLRAYADRLPPVVIAACEESDDAFDACISALAMWDAREALLSLPRVDDPQLRLEGIIWHPHWIAGLAAAAI